MSMAIIDSSPRKCDQTAAFDRAHT